MQKLSIDATVDRLVVLTACYFHDLVSLPKNHPEHHCSSVLAIKETRRVLMRDLPDSPQQRLSAVCHVIEVHSFSVKIASEIPEAKIVQGVDRPETLGVVGLARVFAVSGALGVVPFDAEGLFARKHSLDDKQYAFDHFRTRLLTLPLTMQVEQGRHLAQHNADFLLTHMAELSAELKEGYEMLDLGAIQPFKAR